MVKMILFVCGDCNRENTIHQNDELWTLIETTTESLTEAMEHVKLGHRVYTEYREEE